MTHAGDVACPCVVDHTPNPVDIEVHHVHPLYAGGPDVAANRTPLCPSGHSAVHWLLRRYERHGGTPPWEDRRRLNPWLRRIAADGWAAIQRTKETA